MTRSAPSWCKSRGSGATVVTRRILEVEARVAVRRRWRLVSTAAAPIPNKTSRKAPIFPVEKNPAEFGALVEVARAETLKAAGRRETPSTSGRWNQPPVVFMSKIGWPAGMYVQRVRALGVRIEILVEAVRL